MKATSLLKHYKPKAREAGGSLDTLADRYRQGRNRTILEALACGAAITGLNFGEGFDPASLTPQMAESFHLAFPNLNVEDLDAYSGEELVGLLTAWKGKLFEVSVRDRLNDGEWVGSYHLEPGQTAELAESVTQPGWDLQILNSDGSVAEQIQLKSTDYVSYVEQALDRYPDYQVLATAELEAHQGTVDGLVVSDIQDGQLEAELAQAVSEDSLGLLDIGFPLLPMALNAYWVSTGKRTPLEGLGGVAVSGAAMYGGTAISDVVTDAAGDLLGDVVVDGLLGSALDVVFGFGIFTLGRLALKAINSSKQSEERHLAHLAKEKREYAAANVVIEHIDGAYARFDRTLNSLLSHPPYTRPT